MPSGFEPPGTRKANTAYCVPLTLKQVPLPLPRYSVKEQAVCRNCSSAALSGDGTSCVSVTNVLPPATCRCVANATPKVASGAVVLTVGSQCPGGRGVRVILESGGYIRSGICLPRLGEKRCCESGLESGASAMMVRIVDRWGGPG